MALNKHDAMLEWLESNPGKEGTDWLLEVRCKDDRQREEFKDFLDRVKAGVRSVDFQVAPEDSVPNVQVRIPGQPNFIRTSEQVDDDGGYVDANFDFVYCGYHFDLDAPDSLFENIDSKSPAQAGWKYLEWKAGQLGVENTTFVMQAREEFREFRFGLTHWKDLDKMIHK